MKKIFSILCFVFVIAPVVARADEGEFDMDRWNTILNNVQDRAVTEKISPAVINTVIQDGAFIPQVVQKDQNQAEFTIMLDDYIARAVSAERITKGLAAKKKYPTLLKKVDKQFGVPANVILAFWGMESRYGEYKAAHQLSDAFLTLIYDGRRETFFTNQLIALMHIADDNKLDIAAIRGSWAGAMGHFQFIPTTLKQYGMDGNGDGKIDIINNISDAMYSAGNYLSQLGWDGAANIVFEVALPVDFDSSLCDGKTKKSIDDWAAIGITDTAGNAIMGTDTTGIVCDATCCANVAASASTDSTNATNDVGAEHVPPVQGTDNNPNTAATDTAVAPAVKPCRAFLTFDNFYRIKKWNNSNSYAVAIALLADELKK